MTWTIRDAIGRVVAGEDLDQAEACRALDIVMAGEATDAEIAGLLIALRMKRETVSEICGAVEAMRARVLPVQIDADIILDTCGTGGDGAGTFNVSTAVAFVCAAAGVTVAKHGNRAISSRVGSADVLEALGVRIDLNEAQVSRCIAELGVGFMFAPTHHAALRHAGPARRQLGVRTMLNLLGPMTNPAAASHQLIGIFDRTRLETIARVLSRLGTRRAMVVHGDDGLDEVTITGPTHAVMLAGGEVTALTITPEDLGVPRADISRVAGGSREDNAAIIRAVLAGEDGPAADIVRLNAGCALFVAEQAPSLHAGVALATALLTSGAALVKLEALAERSQALGEG